jgi:hypothetical protein
MRPRVLVRSQGGMIKCFTKTMCSFTTYESVLRTSSFWLASAYSAAPLLSTKNLQVLTKKKLWRVFPWRAARFLTCIGFLVALFVLEHVLEFLLLLRIRQAVVLRVLQRTQGGKTTCTSGSKTCAEDFHIVATNLIIMICQARCNHLSRKLYLCGS